MSKKTILVKDADRLIRVPDKSRLPSSRAISIVLAIAVFAIAALVAHFYFAFGPVGAVLLGLGSVLLAPVFVALVILVLGLLAFLAAAPPFYIVRFKRNRDARHLLDAMLAGPRSKRIILFLRQFDPHRGWKLKAAISWDYQKSGMEQVDNVFQRFNLDSWADELSSPHDQVLKVADRIDVHGGSIRLDDKSWKDKVRELILAADSIAILPGLREGVLWEAEQIKALKRIHVTTFIMPYGYTPDQGETGLWETYRVKYAELGLDFPPYSCNGMLMQFDHNGLLFRAMPIVGSRNEELRAFIVAQG